MTGEVLQWLDGPAAGRLLAVLGHFCWQGAAVWFAAVLVGRGLAGRAAGARYRAELAAFAVLCACPAVTWGVAGSGGGGGLVVRGEAHAKPQAVAPSGESIPTLSAGGGGSPAEPAVLPSAPPVGEVVAGPPAPRLSAWVLGLYGVGVCVGGLRLVAGAAGVAALKRSLVPVPDDVRERVDALAGRLGLRRAPRAGFSRWARAPCAAGWVRPAVVLPLAWAGRVPPDALDAAIAHELAHLRGGDVWVNLVQRLAETVLFYHPAVWLLSGRVRSARELCRDADAARALGDPAAVARGLEFAATFAAPPRRRGALFCPSFGSESMPVLDRVNALLGTPPRRPRTGFAPAAAVVAALALLAAAVPLTGLAAAWAGPPDPPDADAGTAEIADAAFAPTPTVAEAADGGGDDAGPPADAPDAARRRQEERWRAMEDLWSDRFAGTWQLHGGTLVETQDENPYNVPKDLWGDDYGARKFTNLPPYWLEHYPAEERFEVWAPRQWDELKAMLPPTERKTLADRMRRAADELGAPKGGGEYALARTVRKTAAYLDDSGVATPEDLKYDFRSRGVFLGNYASPRNPVRLQLDTSAGTLRFDTGWDTGPEVDLPGSARFPACWEWWRVWRLDRTHHLPPLVKKDYFRSTVLWTAEEGFAPPGHVLDYWEEVQGVADARGRAAAALALRPAWAGKFHEKVMSTPITLAFRGATAAEALYRAGDDVGVAVQLDRPSLTGAGLDPDRPTDLRVRGKTLRELLYREALWGIEKFPPVAWSHGSQALWRLTITGRGGDRSGEATVRYPLPADAPGRAAFAERLPELLEEVANGAGIEVEADGDTLVVTARRFDHPDLDGLIRAFRDGGEAGLARHMERCEAESTFEEATRELHGPLYPGSRISGSY